MADNGVPCVSDFCTPEDLYRARAVLHQTDITVVSDGGYENAERQRIWFFPSWMPPEAQAEMKTGGTVRVMICGSGYEKLDHRSYLGALLATGIRREKCGDIVCIDDSCAVLFCDETIANFLTQKPSPLQKVGRDTVKIRYPAPDVVLPERQFTPVTDTVASARLDCAVASLTNLAREKAQSLIRSGDVTLNYSEELQCDKMLASGDVISIRRYGKFRIESLVPKQKGTRLRLSAVKYK